MSFSSVSQLQKRFEAGVEAFRTGRLAEAWTLLSEIDHPQALNLAAVCARRLGRVDDAADAFAKATRLAPADPEIANNYGHFELGRGDRARAEALFRSALEAAPGMVAAQIGLAKVAAAQADWRQAKRLWTSVLRTRPNSREGRYGLATAQLELGRADQAVDLYSALLKEKDDPAIAFMLGRALLELGDLSAAQACLKSAHERAPAAHSLRALANLYWMQGETMQFDALVRAAPAELVPLAIQLVAETGDIVRARAAWQAAYAERAPDGDAFILASQIARFEGRGEAAAEAARQALALVPDEPSALEAAIVAELMLGRAHEALGLLLPLRRRDPLSQRWIAHESVARRLVGERQPGGLCDVGNFVRVYDIDVPRGFSSLEAFNAEFARRLRELHVFQTRPLNQSLRGQGTQTVRDLQASNDPVIRAYIEALDGPIRQYLADIGQDAGHPTSQRNTGAYRFHSMWSVRLSGQGYHEAHVHPEGWISSAYYVVVPDGIETASDRAGWIGFGAPPYITRPSLDALKWVAPRAGQLALFPSFMWHGTAPITDKAERITAPFDLLPG